MLKQKRELKNHVPETRSHGSVRGQGRNGLALLGKTLSLYVIAFFVVLKSYGTGLGVETPPTYTVLYVSESPVLDGKINDAVWSNAYPVSGFVVLGHPESVAVKQTVFRAVYTMNALYLAIECREPDMDKLQTATAEIWHVDSVEVFIQPRAGGPYQQMIVSSDGIREECRDIQLYTSTFSWDAKVCHGVDFYGMEVRFPFNQANSEPPFDIFATGPGSGEDWRFNIARNTTTTNSDRYSTWSHLTGWFHEPENFGKVVFSGAGINNVAMNREMFKRRYEAMDVWIKAYKNIYRKYDKDFFDYITKYHAEIGLEELRQKAARIDGFSPEDIELAKQELEKIAGRISEIETMRGDMLKKRLFNVVKE